MVLALNRDHLEKRLSHETDADIVRLSELARKFEKWKKETQDEFSMIAFIKASEGIIK
jgi:hypothetical protein